jgi:hypothetical protein
LHRLLLAQQISPGIALEDWTGVHFREKEIYKAITSKRGARAYTLRAVYGSVQEVPMATEYLKSAESRS